jgi:hypothetical protein
MQGRILDAFVNTFGDRNGQVAHDKRKEDGQDHFGDAPFVAPCLDVSLVLYSGGLYGLLYVIVGIVAASGQGLGGIVGRSEIVRNGVLIFGMLTHSHFGSEREKEDF